VRDDFSDFMFRLAIFRARAFYGTGHWSICSPLPRFLLHLPLSPFSIYAISAGNFSRGSEFLFLLPCVQ
jgi:hypothetical protein